MSAQLDLFSDNRHAIGAVPHTQLEMFNEIPPCGRARCPRWVILEVKPLGVIGRCLVCDCWSHWKSHNARPQ